MTLTEAALSSSSWIVAFRTEMAALCKRYELQTIADRIVKGFFETNGNLQFETLNDYITAENFFETYIQGIVWFIQTSPEVN